VAARTGPKGIHRKSCGTGFYRNGIDKDLPENVLQAMIDKVPLKRMGSAEEVANAYLWLASDDASYINGAVISVDGGVTT